MQHILIGGMRKRWLPSRCDIWALKHKWILVGLGGSEEGQVGMSSFRLEEDELLYS